MKMICTIIKAVISIRKHWTDVLSLAIIIFIIRRNCNFIFRDWVVSLAISRAVEALDSISVD
jgi:hypothetical protein